MHYFVHHESRICWAQPGATPVWDDGVVGECDEPRFRQLLAEGYMRCDDNPHFTFKDLEDPDPWT